MLTKHAGATGIRVNVIKPCLRGRTAGNRKTDWTAVYIRERDLKEMLPLVNFDLASVTEAIRKSSQVVIRVEGESFSRTCVAGAKRILNAEVK